VLTTAGEIIDEHDTTRLNRRLLELMEHEDA